MDQVEVWNYSRVAMDQVEGWNYSTVAMDQVGGTGGGGRGLYSNSVRAQEHERDLN